MVALISKNKEEFFVLEELVKANQKSNPSR
jgi:hypothetical protein